MFLATWKDIPNENELQYQIKECHLNAGRHSLNDGVAIFSVAYVELYLRQCCTRYFCPRCIKPEFSSLSTTGCLLFRSLTLKTLNPSTLFSCPDCSHLFFQPNLIFSLFCFSIVMPSCLWTLLSSLHLKTLPTSFLPDAAHIRDSQHTLVVSSFSGAPCCGPHPHTYKWFFKKCLFFFSFLPFIYLQIAF